MSELHRVVVERPIDVVPPANPNEENVGDNSPPPPNANEINTDPRIERLKSLQISCLPRSEVPTDKSCCVQTYPQYWPKTFALLLAGGSVFRLFVAALDFVLVILIIILGFEHKSFADPVSTARIVFSFLIPTIVVGIVLGSSGAFDHNDNNDDKSGMQTLVVLILILIVSVAFKVVVFVMFGWTVVESLKWVWNNWGVPYSPKELLELRVSAQALARFEALTSSWPLWVVSNVWLQHLLVQHHVLQKNPAFSRWEIVLGIRVFVGAVTFVLDAHAMKPWRLYLVEPWYPVPICSECEHGMSRVRTSEDSNLNERMMRHLCSVCERDQDDVWYQCFHEGNHHFVCSKCVKEKEAENQFVDPPMFLFEVEKNLVGWCVLAVGCCKSETMKYASRVFPLLTDIVMLMFYMPVSRMQEEVMAATSNIGDRNRMNMMESEAICSLLVMFGALLVALLVWQWLSPIVVRKRWFVGVVKVVAVCFEVLFWWMILVIIVHWQFIWTRETVLQDIGLVYFCARWGWWVLRVLWDIWNSSLC